LGTGHPTPSASGVLATWLGVYLDTGGDGRVDRTEMYRLAYGGPGRNDSAFGRVFQHHDAVVMMGPFYVHTCAVRWAKFASSIGGAPVIFWTLS
jgi:hypothetical protein